MAATKGQKVPRTTEPHELINMSSYTQLKMPMQAQAEREQKELARVGRKGGEDKRMDQP